MQPNAQYMSYLVCWLLCFGACGVSFGDEESGATTASTDTRFELRDIEFRAHDGVEMFGRLALPKEEMPRAVVIYVQTAEGATVDQKRPLGGGKSFNYFDLYRVELPARNIAFFSYEGRGIRMGTEPPRFEQVDRDVFNTSTLDNKVRDALSALETVRKQQGLEQIPVILMGASEGTLIAAEAASRKPDSVAGLALYGVLAWNMRENFKFIMSDGSFIPSRPLDKDGDGLVTRAEWDVLLKDAKEIDFSKVDFNGDGVFSPGDFEFLNKKYIDAVDNDDFQILNDWGKSAAGVVLPNNWFKDHFTHAEIWSFLKDLSMPVGLFHGDRDGYASMAALKTLEAQATAANLTNLEFHYFEGLDHSLNIGEYFVKGEMPKGHQAIFDYIDRIAPKE